MPCYLFASILDIFLYGMSSPIFNLPVTCRQRLRSISLAYASLTADRWTTRIHSTIWQSTMTIKVPFDINVHCLWGIFNLNVISHAQSQCYLPCILSLSLGRSVQFLPSPSMLNAIHQEQVAASVFITPQRERPYPAVHHCFVNRQSECSSRCVHARKAGTWSPLPTGNSWYSYTTTWRISNMI